MSGALLSLNIKMTLPQPTSSSAYVDVTIIPSGFVSLPEYTLHKDGTDEIINLIDYAFLIEHERLGKKVLFDLGVAKVVS
jgi:hypothetical protein